MILGGKHGAAFRKTDQIRFEHMSQGLQEIYRLTRISAIEQEVGDLIGEDAISRMIDRDDFVQRLNGFLEKQTRTDRMIFVLRFWYMETPREIAKHMGLKEKNVYNTLYQMRKRFRVYWEQSGKEDTVYEKA